MTHPFFNIYQVAALSLTVGLMLVLPACTPHKPSPPTGAMSVRVGEGYSPYNSTVGNGNNEPYGVSAGGCKAPGR